MHYCQSQCNNTVLTLVTFFGPHSPLGLKSMLVLQILEGEPCLVSFHTKNGMEYLSSNVQYMNGFKYKHCVTLHTPIGILEDYWQQA
jgi:hypothetical protein